MRFKANSDSPGNKSLLSGEGQRARPEKEISANNADLEREKKVIIIIIMRAREPDLKRRSLQIMLKIM